LREKRQHKHYHQLKKPSARIDGFFLIYTRTKNVCSMGSKRSKKKLNTKHMVTLKTNLFNFRIIQKKLTD